MKAIYQNNVAPNEKSLGFNYYKLTTNGYIQINDDTFSKNERCSHRNIELPKEFEILYHEKVCLCSNLKRVITLKFGAIKYNSFSDSSLIIGSPCQLYKIHIFMNSINLKHTYLFTSINLIYDNIHN